MGFDMPNLRFVYHLDIGEPVDDYYPATAIAG
jgi:superfamily II DNA helicase RecQ